MAYTPPTIGAAGLTISQYLDILNSLLNSFQSIYGPGAYVGNDAAEYQWISTVCLKINDTLQGLQLVYLNRSPATAVGAGLDGIVKLSGIARKQATASSVTLTITGTANTVIANGVARDVNGFLWDLPSTVTIPMSGTIDVTATCETLGAVSAAPSTISIINNPTAGWSTVNNAGAAAIGQPIETDAQLRARFYLSVALPSQTRVDGTLAGLKALPNVTRATVAENPTGATDIYGNPPHSITAVVEGDTDQNVAQTIYNNKTPGCYTNGASSVAITDPYTGFVTTIRFDRPTYVAIVVVAQVHIISGNNSATQAAVQAAIVGYLNSLQIGEPLTLSALSAYVMAQAGSLEAPTFSIRSLTLAHSGLLQTATINAAGTGYAVNDVLIVNQNNSSNAAQVKVTSVGGSGNITGISLIQTGTDYVTATGVALLETGAGVGTGATVNITASGAAQTLDVGVNFNEVTQGVTGNVTVNLV